MGNPIWVNPDFELEFFMIDSFLIPKGKTEPLSKQHIYPTKRADEHFFMVLETIRETEDAIQRNSISPDWGRKCDPCDMKVACEAELYKINKGYYANKQGQTLFSFVSPLYSKIEEPPIKTQKQLRLRLRSNTKKI